MRRFFMLVVGLCLLGCLFGASAAMAGGSFVPVDVGTGHWLRSVSFGNAKNVWAVGDYAEILHSSDGGRTWAAQPSGMPSSAWLSCVKFVDPFRGWASSGASDSVLRTINGGKTWTPVLAGFGQSVDAIDFVDKLHGWGTNGNAGIVRTTDGGLSWQQLATGYPALSYRAIDFVDSKHGWLSALGPSSDPQFQFMVSILRTVDGGQTWQRVYESGGSGNTLISSICFVNSKCGWAVGYHRKNIGDYETPFILHTADGGITWTEQSYGSGPHLDQNLDCVDFLNGHEGWAVGYDFYGSGVALLLHTVDGGKTWTQLDYNVPQSWVYAVDFYSPTVGLAVGANNILRYVAHK
jgi:photosystem II stability/assembly factor-like uncharacterized protein